MSAAELAAAARALAGELRRRRRWGARRTAGLAGGAAPGAPAPGESGRPGAASPGARPATAPGGAAEARATAGTAPDTRRRRPGRAPAAPAPAPAPAPARQPAADGPAEIPRPTIRRTDLPAADPAALDLDGLRRGVATCMGCRLSAGAAGSGALPGRGAHRPRILYICDHVGPAERACGRVLAPELGDMLRRITEKLGVAMAEVHATAAVKCPLPAGAVPAPAEVAACRRWLAREVELLEPRTLVAFGSVATRALFGPDTDWEAERGRLLQFNGVPTVVTQPPRDMQADKALRFRAWEELQLLLPALGDERA